MQVIRAQGVGKRYNKADQARARTLKEAVLRGFKQGRGGRFWALDGVSFSVEQSRAIGIIGGNGAGKSTLLRLLARVEQPDRGTIDVHGRVGALLELGGSFHHELTGIENIILSSVIAGLTRKEARARVDEIVAFAELEQFISSPLRVYSTGMVMRLAFSIASHIDPDVLLVDEALAVGDLSFQKRCMDRIRAFRSAGATIVIVSHDSNRIRDLCDEVVWLRAGRVVAQGPPMEVTAKYVESQAEETRRITPREAPVEMTPAGDPLEVHKNRFGSLEATIDAVHVRDGWSEDRRTFSTGSPINIDFDLGIPERIGDAWVSATIRRADDVVCLDSSSRISAGKVDRLVRLEISRLDLAPGEYVVDVGLFSADWSRTFDYHYGAYPLTILGSSPGAGVLAPPTAWHVVDRAVAP